MNSSFRCALRWMLDVVEGVAQRLVRDRLFQITTWRRAPARAAGFRRREITCTGMCRVARIVLEPVENGPARHIGQRDIQRDCAGLELARQGQGVSPREATSALMPRSCARSTRMRANVDIILDDQQHRSPGWIRFGRRRIDRSSCRIGPVLRRLPVSIWRLAADVLSRSAACAVTTSATSLSTGADTVV